MARIMIKPILILSPSLEHGSNFNQKRLWMLNVDLDTGLPTFNSEFLKIK